VVVVVVVVVLGGGEDDVENQCVGCVDDYILLDSPLPA